MPPPSRSRRDPPAPEQVRLAISAVLRWASRGDVRLAMTGPAGAGLSPTDLWLLDAVVARGPLRVSELADWQGVDKSTMTPQLRRLEDRGLVARGADDKDRRAVLMTATDAGRALLDEVHASGAALFERVLEGWTVGEREELARLLARFAADLSAPTE